MSMLKLPPSKSAALMWRARWKLGLTQAEMAVALDCSRSAIQSIELGRLELSPKMSAKIAAATGENLRLILDTQIKAYGEKLYRAAGL